MKPSTRSSVAIRWLAVIATLGMFLVDMVGFLDTQTGSALGCGQDWPLCNGAVVPRFGNVHVVIEFAHRAIVGGFALITVILVMWALYRYRASGSRAVKGFSALAVGFIVIQSLLGAAAVLWVNPPVILALHLGFGLLALVGTALLAVVIFRLEQGQGLHRPAGMDQGLRRWVVAIWMYTFAAMYWGSYVAFRVAGPACHGWPLCNGRWLPTGGLMWLDYVHRLLAVGLAVLVTILLFKLYRRRHQSRDLWVTTIVVAVLVGTQIATGAYLVAQHLATGVYLLHVGNLTILFVVLSYLTFRSLESDG
jgi:cytochrome c oxidase assembly protein subunit 15